MPSGRGDTRSSRRALAARYRSRLPWNSRCSVVILVNTAARNATLVGPVQLERVRRGLERDMGATGVADLRQLGLQLGRLGRRLPRRVGGDRIPDAAIHGRDRRGGDPCRSPRVPEEGRRRGLTVGPGDPDDAEIPAGMVVEGGGEIGERHARVLDEDQRDQGFERPSPGSRSATTATAPRRTASATNPCPSARSPGMATKRAPGETSRESEAMARISRPCCSGRSAASIPQATRRSASGRAVRVGCTVAVYGRVAPIMAGKKQKRAGTPASLADALAATRAAHRRVVALAARLEETERTILAAMAPAAAAPVASSAPAKRAGRPAKAAAAPAGAGKRPVGRPRKAATVAAPAKRAVGRPRKSAAAPAPAKRPVGRPRKSAGAPAAAKRPVGRPRTRPIATSTTTPRGVNGRRPVGRPPKS